jgi:hypothetical protein
MRQPKGTISSPRLPIKKEPQRASTPGNTHLGDDLFLTWRKVSEYAGRGIRTLQRWERDYGFPIHRPDPKNRSSVVASKREIDAWFRNCPLQNGPQPQQNRTAHLLENARRVERQAKRMFELSRQMHENLAKARETAARKKPG